VAGLACGAVALTLPVSPSRPEVPGPARAALGVVAAAFAVVLVAGDDRRLCAAGETVVAGGAAAYTWRQAAADIDGGLPRMALPLLAGAFALVGLASALLVLAPLGPVPRRLPVRWRVAGAGALAALAGAAAVVGGAWAVEHRTAVDAATAAPSGARPGPIAPRRVLWTWDTPGGQVLNVQGFNFDGMPGDDDVVGAGPGVAVRTDDGVVALDGRTGRERWHYRRPGTSPGATGLYASPGGAWVVAWFASGSPDAVGGRWLAFDGETGRVGLDRVVAGPGGVDDRFASLLTSRTLVERRMLSCAPGCGPDGGRERLAGLDLATGSRLWDWRMAGDCRSAGARPVIATRDTVLVSMVCRTGGDLGDLPVGRPGTGQVASGDVAVVALDDRTGLPRWRRSRPYRGTEFGRLGAGVAGLSDDGVTAQLTWDVAGDEGEPVHDAELVHASTGALLPAGGELPRVVPDTVLEPVGAVVGRAGVVTVEPVEDGHHRYRLHRSQGDEAEVASQCRHAPWVALPDALVEACPGGDAGRGPGRTAIAVTTWRRPGRQQAVDVDLVADPAAGADRPPRDWVDLVVTPGAVVVWAAGGTRLTALG
jgi:outer membrane protein assembly factor BamB